jgi:hypothetical protein
MIHGMANREERVEAFTLRMDEVRLLANYRRLPPEDKRGAVEAMEDYLGRLGRARPAKGSTEGKASQTGGGA